MSTAAIAERWSARIVHHRRIVAIAWIVGCALILPRARHIESVLRVAARVEGSESAAVDEQLASRFHSPFAHSMVLVASGVPSPLTPPGAALLRSLVDSLQSTPGVTRVLSYLDTREPLFIAASAARADGTFLVVGLDEHRAADILLDSLRSTTRLLAMGLSHSYPGATLRWTGESALNVDLRRASAEDARRAEWHALPLTLALLVLAFGAVVAALVPVGAALLAIAVALGIAAVIGEFVSLSILLQNVVTMIGLGLGIDYALLVLQRFRESQHSDAPQPANGAEHAAREALRHAGPTIVLSGTAVAIGFGALALVPVNELRSVAVGGLAVTAVSILVATTLIPGLLATLGRHIDLGRVRLVRHGSRMSWERWAAVVSRNPGRVLVLAGLPVVLLAWQARRLSTDRPRGDWLPKDLESANALRALDAMGRSAVVQTIRLTIEFPAGILATSDSGWAATTRLARRLVADPDVSRVRSLPGLLAPLGLGIPRHALLAALPDDVHRAFLSRDGETALMEVIPREGLTPPELAALVMRLRSGGDVGARVRVGGLPALNVDYENAVAGPGRFAEIVTAIVVVTFLVLAIGFRSLLVPLKAIVLNLVAVAAAFGAVTLVFQEGIGARLVGVAGPLGGIFPAIPVLVFCVVFGLSMDYEVFLVARVRQARLAGRAEREAIAEGLAQTGRLITSAAAIMIVVFGAFMLEDFLLMKMLGFALAVAVLLDATVMRLAVSPALLALAGRWNWWPGERASDIGMDVSPGVAAHEIPEWTNASPRATVERLRSE